ncbi:hypothetical protein [Haloarcula marismortui]|jgi:hypothetical protein|uniref:Uncharacterized protein n=1 Tax=Haloarcula marismortui ATCC 33799 TaxID=662475 RepID=M0KC79_9EURY|nr:hypothetical protein [Haloarcula californiae]EMA18423.1 hypothetical protein C435_09484 [Haloarcula californiae ATCC 33799]
MDETSDDNSITLELTRNEAMVMLEWLERMDKPEDRENLEPFEAAVLSVRADVECILEASHSDIFAPGYEDKLENAIDDVRYNRSGDA